jgi:hypothetical protein
MSGTLIGSCRGEFSDWQERKVRRSGSTPPRSSRNGAYTSVTRAAYAVTPDDPAVHAHDEVEDSAVIAPCEEQTYHRHDEQYADHASRGHGMTVPAFFEAARQPPPANVAVIR